MTYTEGKARTILLVDDEPAIRQCMRLALISQQYNVLEAASGKQALAVALRHDAPIHLLLTDVSMPGISGYDLAERLKANHPEMQVVYMTGCVVPEVGAHRPLAGGALLEKPFDIEMLLSMVRELMDNGHRSSLPAAC